MAIQPIDLQTLYTQMDKIGKNVAAEQRAKEVGNIEQAERFNREQQIKEMMVQESSEQNKIDVQKDGGRQFQGQQSKNENSPKEQSSSEPEIFRDPAIGGRIDFSG